MKVEKNGISMARLRDSWHRGGLPKYLAKKEIDEFLQIAYTYSYHHGLAFELLWLTGIRSFELANIVLGDIDFENSRIRINRGKGRKDRIVPITKKYLEKLSPYLKKRGIDKLERNVFSFPPSSQRYWCEKYRELTSFREKGLPHPHTFRHSFAVYFLQQAETKHLHEALEIVRRVLGHKDISMTSIYLNFLTDDIQEVYTRIFEPEEETIRL